MWYESAPPAPPAPPAPSGGTYDQIRSDLSDLAAQGVTEFFTDLNFDPEIGGLRGAPADALARAEEVLDALAP